MFSQKLLLIYRTKYITADSYDEGPLIKRLQDLSCASAAAPGEMMAIHGFCKNPIAYRVETVHKFIALVSNVC